MPEAAAALMKCLRVVAMIDVCLLCCLLPDA